MNVFFVYIHGDDAVGDAEPYDVFMVPVDDDLQGPGRWCPAAHATQLREYWSLQDEKSFVISGSIDLKHHAGWKEWSRHPKGHQMPFGRWSLTKRHSPPFWDGMRWWPAFIRCEVLTQRCFFLSELVKVATGVRLASMMTVATSWSWRLQALWHPSDSALHLRV